MTYSPLSFLYVEDDPPSRGLMSVLLRRVMGCQNVTILEDSSDFLARLAGLPVIPDIILLDIHIAPVNGIELLKMIRGRSEYDSVRVIALTASVTASEVMDLKKCGFDGLIGKPVRPSAFPQLIERIMAGKSVWMVP